VIVVTRYRARRARRRERPKSPARQLLSRIATGVVVFMIVTGSIYALVSLATSNAVFVPNGTNAILKSARNHSTVNAWTAESSRIVVIGGQRTRFDAEQTVTVDLKRNAFQATVIGRFSDTVSYLSDGRVTIGATATDQQAGKPWRIVRDPCRKQAPLSSAGLAEPAVDDILAGSPHMLTPNADFGGRQAWQFSFTPSHALLSRMLWLGFLDQAEPASKAWTLPSSDRLALKKGGYKLVGAEAWVTRDPRMLQAIQVELTMPSGDQLTLRATMSVPKLADPFKNYQLGRRCR
jgi:hypothetical protein